MTLRLLRGDMRATLAGVAPGSVQTCVTSPPYYGLRSYSTPPLVWGGDADCAHMWSETLPGIRRDYQHVADSHTSVRGGGHKVSDNNHSVPSTGSFCSCGAWLGHLGLEPTPDLFVAHIVECFRAVRRVLRDDATCWVNLGDSYAGSGKGPTGHNGIGNQAERQGFDGESVDRPTLTLGGRHAQASFRNGTGGAPGLKAKDLMMMPARVAMALQADGWYLRSMIPWLKRNAMPESVTDRPATSVEYVFLLSKSGRYFYDPDAVRQRISDTTYERNHGGLPERTGANGLDTVQRSVGTGKAQSLGVSTSGRNWRNSDLFFQTWQGMLLDSDDLPLALVVNPAPYKDAHYATFPPKLVEPMIKASTSERGCCAECGAPLTCKHSGDPVPQTVLDCFAGANTTLLVADRLGRNGLGCELSESYSDMGSARLVGDAPMFVELESA